MSTLGTIIRKLGGTFDVLSAHLKGCERIDGIEVYGRPEFRRALMGALLLLRDKKLPPWDTLARHVNRILEGRRTTVIVTAHPAFMFIDGPHSNQAAEFLAATIAFEACSVQLHRSYEAEYPGLRVPKDIYSGSAARERCMKAYQECLVALNDRSRSGNTGRGLE